MPTKEAALIKGFNADSFMLKLNQELELPQPQILDRPFSSLLAMLENIGNVNSEKEFNVFEERLALARENVQEAIAIFEEGEKQAPEELEEKIDIGKLKKQIIDIIIAGEYNDEQIEIIEQKASSLVGPELEELADLRAALFNNWGIALSKLARIKNDLGLFEEAMEKYEKAITIKPDDHEAFNNWGNALYELAKIKNDPGLFEEAIEKYEKAITIKPDYHEAFYNWGNVLSNLAEINNDSGLFEEAIENYEKTIKLKPDYHEAFYNWGSALSSLYHKSKDPSLLEQMLEKAKAAYELGGGGYNLACAYALKKDKENAFKYLEESLEKKQISLQHVKEDNDWDAYREDPDFIALLEKFEVEA